MTPERRPFNEKQIFPTVVSEIKKQAPDFPNIHPTDLAKTLNIKIETVEDIPVESKDDPSPIGFLNYQNGETTLQLSKNTTLSQKRIAIAKSVFCYFDLKQKLPNTDFSSEIYDLNSKSSNLRQTIWDIQAIDQYLLAEEVLRRIYLEEKKDGLTEIIKRISDDKKILLPTKLVLDRLIKLGIPTLEESTTIDPSRQSLIDLCEKPSFY